MLEYFAHTQDNDKVESVYTNNLHTQDKDKVESESVCNNTVY